MFHRKLDDSSELKTPDPADAAELFALIDNNRARLREWLPWLDFNKTAEDSSKFIKSNIQNEADKKGITALIWHKGKIAGVASQHLIDWSNKKVSLGYWIGEAFEGKGLITRATEALTDHSIREDKLNRVELRIATGNNKSWAVAERLGFQFEGVARSSEWLYDHFVDHKVYAMLAADWLKARARS